LITISGDELWDHLTLETQGRVPRFATGDGAMARIHQAETEKDQAQVRELFWEYLQWANERLNQEFGVNFDIESMLEQNMADLEMFLPPYGRLLLAAEGSHAAGIACMQRIQEGIGEIKRMYVRPEFRGKGIGRALLEGLMAEAQQMGYRTIRLDSVRFMAAAHSLYRSVGFQEIEPYSETEIPPEFHRHWVFMEKKL
jgi:GNAT superfamily N-acetyltransferase